MAVSGGDPPTGAVGKRQRGHEPVLEQVGLIEVPPRHDVYGIHRRPGRPTSGSGQLGAQVHRGAELFLQGGHRLRRGGIVGVAGVRVVPVVRRGQIASQYHLQAGARQIQHACCLAHHAVIGGDAQVEQVGQAPLAAQGVQPLGAGTAVHRSHQQVVLLGDREVGMNGMPVVHVRAGEAGPAQAGLPRERKARLDDAAHLRELVAWQRRHPLRLGPAHILVAHIARRMDHRGAQGAHSRQRPVHTRHQRRKQPAPGAARVPVPHVDHHHPDPLRGHLNRDDAHAAVGITAPAVESEHAHPASNCDRAPSGLSCSPGAPDHAVASFRA